MAKILSEVAAGRANVPQPSSGDVCTVPVWVNFSAELAANDLIVLAELPAGVKLVDYVIMPGGLGGTTPKVSIGSLKSDASDIDVTYESNIAFDATAARCTGIAAANASASAARKIALKTTAASTTAAGKKLLVLLSLVG